MNEAAAQRSVLHRQGVPRALKRLLIASLVAHGVGFFGIVGVAAMSSRGASRPPEAFIATKLVKLGKKRDESLLPRLDSAPPPSAKAVNPAAPKTAPTPATPTPTAAERIKALSKVSHALDRVRREESDEGDPEGVADGEVTRAGLAVMGSKYATEIYRCIRANYSVEGLPPDKVAGSKASVVVKVGRDGRFLDDAEIVEASGLQAFDAAVLRAVRRCGKVSAPPEPLRDRVGKDGIEVVFSP